VRPFNDRPPSLTIMSRYSTCSVVGDAEHWDRGFERPLQSHEGQYVALDPQQRHALLSLRPSSSMPSRMAAASSVLPLSFQEPIFVLTSALRPVWHQETFDRLLRNVFGRHCCARLLPACSSESRHPRAALGSSAPGRRLPLRLGRRVPFAVIGLGLRRPKSGRQRFRCGVTSRGDVSRSRRPLVQ